MDEQALIAFITASLAEHTPVDKIRGDLLSVGWDVRAIDAAFAKVQIPSAPPPPPVVPSTPPVAFTPPVIQQSAPSPITTPASISPFPVLMNAADEGLASRRWRMIKIGLTICTLFLLIGAGGVFAYVGFAGSPTAIAEKMTSTMSDVTTMEYAGVIDVELQAEDIPQNVYSVPSASGTQKSETLKLLMNFSGKSDVRDIHNPKSLFVMNLGVEALGEESIYFGMETRSFGEIFYIMFTDLGDLGFFDLSVLNKQWIKVDPAAIAQQFGLTEEELREFQEQQKNQQLSPEQLEQIRRAYIDAHVITITEKLSADTVEGKKTHHFKYEVNKDGLKKFIVAVAEIVDEDTITDEELRNFDDAMQSIESIGGELWIGKKDYLLHKMTLGMNIRDAGDAGVTGVVNFSLTAKNYNQPVQIEVPSSSKTVEELLESILGNMPGQNPLVSESATSPQRVKAADATIKANISAVRAQAELHYDLHKDSYAGVCTNKDIVGAINVAKAQAGIVSATNVVLNRAGGNGLATCHENGKLGYAVEVPLKSAPTSVFCVDHTGTAKITTIELIANDITCN